MEFNKAYNRIEFLSFLRGSFLPEDFLSVEEEIHFSTQTKYATHAVKLGSSPTLDLVVYEIRHTSRHDARVGLSKEAFRLLADEAEDRALVLFVPEDDIHTYRFSFIEITLNWEKGSSKVVKSFSNPHRYSYLLGEGIACYTPNKYLNEKGRVVNDEDLHTRFSVEVLTKAFYNELSDWYAWAIQIIRFPNNINDSTDDAKYNNESAIRLITRLIFVWFLKQRHLIPDEFFDERYIAENLIHDFNPNVKVDLFSKSNESKYYKAILQNLFFAMLNSPITPEGSNALSERRFRNGRDDYDNNKLMRYESYFSNPQLFVDLANRAVPFLNGGLFDCLDEKDKGEYYDGFSDRESVKKALIVPDYLFFGEEMGKNIDLSEWYGDKNKKKVSARGIIDILKRYNFTVEENTPFDQEVSLDPELLGKVFENLLASYNPETQTTARKQTGSFYTPREIVQYMVDESLVAHLKRTVDEDLEPEFRQLLQYSDEPVNFTKEQRRCVTESLYNCKILDPACGSGAFPMGMLQQKVHILQRIDPDNELWKKMLLENAISETSEVYRSFTDDERREAVLDIERSFDEAVNRPDYARKLYLIENCIYGVDIQPIAIQISKLRFFISLVIDQITNKDATDNFGIRPLPNLEAKFVAANTLIGLNKQTDLFDSEVIKQKEEELKIAKHKIFGAKTIRTKRKYRKFVAELRLSIAETLKESGAVADAEARQLAAWDMFDQNVASPFFDPEWMFGVKDGFDIVIGNPPWGASLSSEEKKQYGILYPEIDSSTPNTFAYFIGLAYKLYNSYLSFVLPDSILIKDFKKTRRLLLDKLIRIIWFENCGIPYDLKKFKYVDHDVCIMNVGYKYIQNILRTCFFYDKSTQQLKEFTTSRNKNDFILEVFDFAFNMKADYSDLVILHKILRNKCISNYMQCHEGIHTGNIREKLFYLNYKDGYKPLFYGGGRGGDIISTYYSKPIGWYVDYRPNIIDKSIKEYASLRDEKIFIYPKIYITRTGNPFKAFYDETTYASNNFFSMQFIDYSRNTENNLKYILPFINSHLCQYFIRVFAAPRLGNTFVETKIFHLLKFAIPIISDEMKNKLISAVNGIIRKKAQNISTTTDEQEIDCLVYHFYDLTYDEVKIVDPKTSITADEYNKEDY